MGQNPSWPNNSGIQPLLDICSLWVAYRTTSKINNALRGASLKVLPQQVVALIGETGSGKSTLALAAMGLLEKCSISGEILYKGKSLDRLSLEEKRKVRGGDMGIIFQDSRSALNPHITILEHVVETIRAHQDLSKKEAKNRAREIFREVGFPEDMEGSYSFKMSGGLCQRAGIALALCNGPELLIADEPTSSIDAALQSQILQLLIGMKELKALAMLFISHDLKLVSQISDQVCVMYHGRIVEAGSGDAIITAPKHPYTKGLKRSQATLQNYHEKQRLEAIVGSIPGSGQEFSGCAFASRCSLAEPCCIEKIPEFKAVTNSHWVACIKADEIGK